MKHLIILVIILFAVDPAQAQFGLKAQSVQITSPTSDNGTARGGIQLGVHYWTRLKELRVEFLPEVSWSSVGGAETGSLDVRPRLQRFAIALPAHFYLLDLISDCNCPTFSKQNDFFKKGLFLQLSPGFRFNQVTATLPEGLNDWIQQWTGSIGIGLDIGLSDLITITPQLQYLTVFGSTPSGSPPVPTQEWNAGVGLTFRPDYRY